MALAVQGRQQIVEDAGFPVLDLGKSRVMRRVDFAPQKLSIELDRLRDNLVSVTFAMAATEFAEASQVVKIISGEIEPP